MNRDCGEDVLYTRTEARLNAEIYQDEEDEEGVLVIKSKDE
jgi:hypothetical protein